MPNSTLVGWYKFSLIASLGILVLHLFTGIITALAVFAGPFPFLLQIALLLYSPKAFMRVANDGEVGSPWFVVFSCLVSLPMLGLMAAALAQFANRGAP